MSISFLCNRPMLVLGFSCYRGANFEYLHWGLGVFSLRKLQKCWTWKFMWGKCSVMEKCISSVGAEVMYLLILCGSILLSNSYKIYFIFIL